MIYTTCPHCRQALQVDPGFSGQTLSCPKCRGGFVAPGESVASPQAEKNGSDQSDTAVALRWAIVGGHITATLLLALAIGPVAALLVIFVAAGIELAIWQHSTGRSASWMAGNIAGKLGLGGKGSQILPSEPLQNRHAPNPHDSLPFKEMQVHRSLYPSGQTGQQAPPVSSRESFVLSWLSRTGGEPIPAPPADYLQHRAEKHRTLNDQGAQLGSSGVYFLGPATQLNLGRGSVYSPFVYVSGSAQGGLFDASLIDGTLPVEVPQCTCNSDLPYWPRYDAATPEQRSHYLDWLVGGRCDPGIAVGYVFIYFYGLERRILVDGEDHLPIAEEILRLQGIYGTNRSFRNYSSSLLWLIVPLIVSRGGRPAEFVDRLIKATDRWDNETLGRCLAYVYLSEATLPTELAFRVAEADSRTATSPIVRRHGADFRELFFHKYNATFAGGMPLRASKRLRRSEYRPASSTLRSVDRESANEAVSSLPDVLTITSQFKPLVDIWEQCIDELRAYDKARRSATGEVNAEQYESLPSELRHGEHPEFGAWLGLWRSFARDNGVPIVPVRQLAAIKGFSERRTLSKSECRKLLATADCLEIGIEPDARLTGRSYRWDDAVTLFFLESSAAEDSARYQAASQLLELGLHLATTADTVDAGKVAHIMHQLEQRFDLSTDESKRIGCLRELRLQVPGDERALFAAIRKRLSGQQRQTVGDYLVGIATAHDRVSRAEMQALRKFYQRLGLEDRKLDDLLAPYLPKSTVVGQQLAAPPEEFHLNREAISRIMSETEAVSAILKDAMQVDEDADNLGNMNKDNFHSIVPAMSAVSEAVQSANEGTAVAIASDRLNHSTAQKDNASSLAQRFSPFFDALVVRSEWPAAEAAVLAHQHQVMLNAAIEAINEWSQDRWGDWLIDEGDPLLIHTELLKDKS